MLLCNSSVLMNLVRRTDALMSVNCNPFRGPIIPCPCLTCVS